MQTNAFEQAFSDFLDRREYDQAENALFAMKRFRPWACSIVQAASRTPVSRISPARCWYSRRIF